VNKKISIIVPVYNVEKYLERCLLSIVIQNVSADDYELIVVNDGSTDSSRNILAEFKQDYPFIRIVDKENGGLSSARNEGLKYATGDFIFFIDSDDWLNKDSLPFLLEWIKEYPADIYLSGIREIYDNGDYKDILGSLSSDNKILDIDDYLCNYTLRSSAWQGLFSRRLFVDNDINFKHGFISEDDDFVVRIFSAAKRIVCNRQLVYYYYQRSDSISKGKAFEEKIINDKIIMLGELDEYIKPFEGKLGYGLQRKLDFLAVDLIRTLIRYNHSSRTIDETLEKMRAINYFPLRKAGYSQKYRIFRILFSSNKAVKSACCLKKYI